MKKIRVGGWSFKVKSNWAEVTHDEALRLYATKEGDIKERVSILTIPNLPTKVDLSDAHWLAIYEICSFILDMPEVVPDTVQMPRVEEWEFRQFELIRRAISQHPNELALTYGRIAQILDFEDAFVEVGAKALDAVEGFMQKFEAFGLFDGEEPTSKERAAGIERLQAFGAYAMTSKIGEKFGILPEEVEKKPTGWVFQEWVYILELARFESEMSK